MDKHTPMFYKTEPNTATYHTYPGANVIYIHVRPCPSQHIIIYIHTICSGNQVIGSVTVKWIALASCNIQILWLGFKTLESNNYNPMIVVYKLTAEVVMLG